MVEFGCTARSRVFRELWLVRVCLGRVVRLMHHNRLSGPALGPDPGTALQEPCNNKEENNTEQGGVQRGRAAVTVTCAVSRVGCDLDCGMTHGPCTNVQTTQELQSQDSVQAWDKNKGSGRGRKGGSSDSSEGNKTGSLTVVQTVYGVERRVEEGRKSLEQE